jgi:hypothetical protein
MVISDGAEKNIVRGLLNVVTLTTIDQQALHADVIKLEYSRQSEDLFADLFTNFSFVATGFRLPISASWSS